MSREEKIEKEVKKTMDLLKKEKSIKTDAFFYTRLQAGIQASDRSRLSKLSSKSVRWKTIILTGLIGINLITAAVWKGIIVKNSNRQKLETALSQEYSLSAETGDWLSISVEE